MTIKTVRVTKPEPFLYLVSPSLRKVFTVNNKMNYLEAEPSRYQRQERLPLR